MGMYPANDFRGGFLKELGKETVLVWSILRFCHRPLISFLFWKPKTVGTHNALLFFATLHSSSFPRIQPMNSLGTCCQAVSTKAVRRWAGNCTSRLFASRSFFLSFTGRLSAGRNKSCGSISSPSSSASKADACFIFWIASHLWSVLPKLPLDHFKKKSFPNNKLQPYIYIYILSLEV